MIVIFTSRFGRFSPLLGVSFWKRPGDTLNEAYGVVGSQLLGLFVQVRGGYVGLPHLGIFSSMLETIGYCVVSHVFLNLHHPHKPNDRSAQKSKVASRRICILYCSENTVAVDKMALDCFVKAETIRISEVCSSISPRN